MSVIILKQNGSATIKIGPFVDDTDGTTAETGLTIANTDVLLSKNGGTFAAKNSGGGTHDTQGLYAITLDSTDLGTVGTLTIYCKMSGALYVRHEAQIVEEAVYDALYGSAAPGPATATQFSSLNDLSAAQVNAEVDTALTDYDGPTKAEMDAAFAALNDLSAAEVNAEVDTALTDYDGPTKAEMDAAFTEIKGATWTATDTLENIRDEIVVVDGIVDDILVDTNEIQTNYLSSTDYTNSLPANFADLAISAGTGYIVDVSNNVNAEVTSLSTIALAQLLGQDIGIYTLTEGSVFDTLRDAIINDAPTAGEVADAVWDEPTADHTTAGTFGAGVEVTTASAVNLIGPAVWAQPWSNYNVGDTNMGNLMENVLNPTSGFIYDMAGSSFDTSTDSLEAIRDRGDAAWITGGGGGGGGDATEAKQDTIISTLADMSGATFDTSTDSLEAIRNRGDSAWVNAAGDGSEEETITITSAGSPVDGALVVVSSSALSDTPAVASGYTDGTGQVTFRLDPGTYYAWVQRNGVDFTNPTAFTVTA